MTTKETANKFGVPKNTISPFQKKFQALEESAPSTKKVRGYQWLSFEWFVSRRSQNIPIDASMIQEKGLFFAKKLEIHDFKASDRWLDK